MRSDVVVIGLGAMGSASLWRLAERGMDVAGFERFVPGNDLGSSHGETRIIRTAYYEHPAYVPLLHRAFEAWRRLELESGTSLLTMTGALMIGPPDSPVVAGTLRSVREHDLAHEVLDVRAMAERYPQHRLDPAEIAIYEEAAGFLYPEPAVRAMADMAKRHGAKIFDHHRVEHMEIRDDGVTVTAGDVTCEARHAIVSVGPWLADFLPGLNLPLVVSRQVLAWFPAEQPEAYDPVRFPVYLHDVGDHIFYGFPSVDNQTIKIALHGEGDPTSADDLDRHATARDFEPVQGFVRDRLPGVKDEAVRSAVCMYTNTPDQHFLLGSPRGAPRVTVLGGFSGHGFKFAPIMGEIAADLATNGRTDLPHDLFSLDRYLQHREQTVATHQGP